VAKKRSRSGLDFPALFLPCDVIQNPSWPIRVAPSMSISRRIPRRSETSLECSGAPPRAS
jgi:hypothetical protein